MNRISRLILSVLAAAGAAFVAIVVPGTSASAQDAPAALLLPWCEESPDERPSAPRAALERASVLLDQRGFGLTDPTVARMRLQAYGRFPAVLAADDWPEFKRLAREALLAVGRIAPGGHDASQSAIARTAIFAALNFARDRLEALNRDQGRAQKVMDACLLLPRLLMAEGASEQQVVLEALECRRLVPGVAPSTDAHPPEIYTALTKAETMARLTLAPARLEVTTTDQCRGCLVFVNGTPLGRTPYAANTLPGTYRIQVDYPGQAPHTALVHEVTLTPGHESSVSVAPFESALRADEQGFYLIKGVLSDGIENSPEALQALARAVQVDRVVLVRRAPSGAHEYRAVNAATGSVCSAERGDQDIPDVELIELVSCESAAPTPVVDLTVRAPGPEAPARADAPPERYLSTRPKRVRKAGFGMLAAGAIALGSTWLAEGLTRDGGARSAESERRYMGASAAAGAVLTASEPLWMPIGRRHAPWWTWAGMAVGLAPVAMAAWAWPHDGRCAEEDASGACLERYSMRTVSALNVFSGLPLVMLPASHYLARWRWGRRAERGSVALHMRYNAGTPHLSLQGTF